MTAARPSVSALPRGHELDPVTFTVPAERVAAYLRAVGDRNTYGETAPPLAVVALALVELQRQVSLPAGALHTAQEVECLRRVRAGEALSMAGRIAQRSERQGFVVSVIDLDISSADGPALRTRTTVMAPAAAS